MKKVLSIALTVMLVFALATTVKAATPSEDLYAYVSKTFTIAGQEVKLLKEAQLVEVDRYLTQNSITEEQYNTVKTQIDNVVAVMNKAGVTDPRDLKGEDEANVKSYVNTAATALNLKVSYDAKNDTVIVKDANGNVITELGPDAFVKLVQTGSTHYEYIAVPAVAIIAVAIVIGYKKVTANA